MKAFTAALVGAFLLSAWPHPSHAHYCPKCVKIETERAEEQAKEGPHPVRYADDLIEHVNYQADGLKTADSKDEVKKSDDHAINRLWSETWLAANNAQSAQNKTQVNSAGSARGAGSTILEVLEIKDFINTLSGPFTLFIPSDEAVRNFPYAAFLNMLRPENRELLFAVVSNHIVPQEILKGDFNKNFKTLGGRVVELQSKEQGLTVNGAAVLKTAPLGNSGIVYVIDQVMIPIHE